MAALHMHRNQIRCLNATNKTVHLPATLLNVASRVPPAAVHALAPGIVPCSNKTINSTQRTLVVAAGSSKQSLYTQLPTRLDEPTPGFDSIASALEDLAAGAFH